MLRQRRSLENCYLAKRTMALTTPTPTIYETGINHSISCPIMDEKTLSKRDKVCSQIGTLFFMPQMKQS